MLYNLLNCCSSCDRLINLEDNYPFHETEKDELTTIEKQVFIFKEIDNMDVYFWAESEQTKRQKLLKTFEFSNNPYKKVIISFIKNKRTKFF